MSLIAFDERHCTLVSELYCVLFVVIVVNIGIPSVIYAVTLSDFFSSCV